MTRSINLVALIVGVALVGSLGCTTGRQDAPPLAGPSELATSVTVYANPDALPRDGGAPSQITIQALSPSNQPIANLPVRLEAWGWGLDAELLPVRVTGDVGQLSADQIVTDGSGRATAIYTSPVAPANTLATVMILATPAGTNATGVPARTATIRLTGSSNPEARFTYLPESPEGAQLVYFDGSASTGQSPITNYLWDFGDGSGPEDKPGPVNTHRFRGCSTDPNNTVDVNFFVTLTVTDEQRRSSRVPFMAAVVVKKCTS